MNFIFKTFLTFSAVSLFLVIYCVQNKIIPDIEIASGLEPIYVYLIYLLIPLFLTQISLLICTKLGDSDFKEITFIETSNNDFLANYLAFFFCRPKR